MRIALLVLAGLALAAGVAGARTITGTPRNDVLVGTPRPDTIRGLAGNDRLLGGGGADYLNGGPGRDVVDAGSGSDRISVEYDGARDAVGCGRGDDVVNADLLDTVAANCELVGRRLSRDPYSSPPSQQETEVEPDSLTVGRTTVAAFQVGRWAEGGATNIGYAVSRDNGRTWASGFLPGLTVASTPPGPHARASDPVVAYDAAHAVWLISSLALEPGTTRLTIHRSPDGASWNLPITAGAESVAEGIAYDKNWVSCDNSLSSPFYGRCYLVYTHSADGDMLAVTTSDDGGVTWSPPTDLGVRGGVGVLPVVRPTGELVVVYLLQSRQFAIAASRSVDGGSTFAAPVRIADVSATCAVRGFRAFPLPSADVDRNGRVWAAWHDCAAPGASTNAVFVSTSDDGVSWAPPLPVTRGRNAMLPAIGIDRSSGRVAIAFHRVASTGVDVELGETPGAPSQFGAPRRLSAQTMRFEWMPNTTSGRMLGDYISVHYAGGLPLVVWVLASEPLGAELRQAVYATRAP